MELSRRNFLIGAAAAAGAASVGALTSTQLARADEATEVVWDYEADVVVCGLGAAGAAAAVSALEEGASVAVIERSSRGGGSTVYSGGLVYMGGTKLQEELGVEDSVENMLAYVSKATGGSGDEELIALFCESSPDLYDWLVAHGTSFEGVLDDTAHNVESVDGICLQYSGNERNYYYAQVATPAPRGHAPVNGGWGVFEPLEEIVNEQATVLYETRATSLVTDDEGAVVGVIAEPAVEEGEEAVTVAVKANKGVVLSCGAFTNNDTMVENYDAVCLPVATRVGVSNDTGDGILMGQAVGGAVKSMHILNLQKFIYRYGNLPRGILVDEHGLRFVAEDCYGTWIGRGIEKRSPNAAWAIVDAVLNEDTVDVLGYDDFQPTYEADTLEELAELLGIEPSVLVATVERYNELVAAGEDLDYRKDAEYLAAVETGPFYAYDCSMTSLSFHTCGGLKINASAKVIDREGEVIAGLYAAGRTSCGIFGEYPGSGSSIADGLTFGRIAGAAAANA